MLAVMEVVESKKMKIRQAAKQFAVPRKSVGEPSEEVSCSWY